MLEQLPFEVQSDIRKLNIILDNDLMFSSDKEIDMLKYRITELVLTILLREDEEKFSNYMITHYEQ